MADDPRLALLRNARRQRGMEGPIPSQSGFVPVGSPFIPIEALRQNIQFYQNQLQQLQAQERIYNLGELSTAAGRFRRRTISNPIIRRREVNQQINYTTYSFYYALPRSGDWIPYARNAMAQTNYLANRVGAQTQLVLSQYNVDASIDFHLGGETLKTTFRNTPAGALASLIQKKADKEDEYEEELEGRTLIVRHFIPTEGQVVGQGTGRSDKAANATWLMIDKKARTNCFYNCLAVLRFVKKRIGESVEEYRLRIADFVDNENVRNHKIGEMSRSLKRNFNPPISNFTDLSVIKAYANYTASNTNQETISVKLYNNIYENFSTIHNDALQSDLDDILISDLDDAAKAAGIKNVLRSVRTYEIQYINNHFIPLVRWSEIPVSRPIDDEGYRIPLSEGGNQTTMIKKWTKEKDLDLRIAAYDLEATPNGVPCFTTFCASLAFYVPADDLVEKFVWYGLDAIKQMIDHIYLHRDLFDGYTFYAHNGGKFDMLLVFKDYVLTDPDCPYKIANDDKRKTICLNGAYIGVCLYTEDGKEIFFKDSLKMMPMSLDKVGKELKVEHPKLDKVQLPDGRWVEIDHDDIHIGNIDDYDIRESQKIYCLQDSLCLLEALLIFATEVHTDTKINITDCFTGASLSKKHFYQSYYNQQTHPLYSLSRDLDAFFRKSYYGGRNEAFYIGEYTGKVYYVDFTSLYPDVGRKILPYGIPKQLSDEKLAYVNTLLSAQDGRHTRNIPFGFYRCKVRTKCFDTLPLHAIKHEGKLTFPHFDNWTELTLFSEELKLGYKRGLYDYKIIDGFSFRKATFMKDFFNSGFTKKAEAKAAGNPALAQTHKIIINSGYGFFGLNTLGKDKEGRDGVEIWKGNSATFWDAYKTQGIVNIGQSGDYTIMRCKKELEISDFNVAVASAITSWARIKIWSFMTDMIEKGARVLYADTDSCIMTESMKSYPDIMEKYCWDGNGDELGSMKNEADDEVKDHFKDALTKEYKEEKGKEWCKSEEGIATIKADTKELFAIQEEYDSGDIYWDGQIGGGCKQYALKRKLLDGAQIEICKMKGYKSKGVGGKKLKYSQFKDLVVAKELGDRNTETIRKFMLEDYTEEDLLAKIDSLIIKQDQVQFRSPLSYHIAEDIGTIVEKTEVSKNFKIQYSKGHIGEDGWITPLHLETDAETKVVSVVALEEADAE